jgi:hypothetical protein
MQMQEFYKKTGTGAASPTDSTSLRPFSGVGVEGDVEALKRGLIIVQIQTQFTPFDSALNGLQLWFWVQSERTDRSAANSRNVRAGVSATMWGPPLSRVLRPNA